MVFHGVLMVKLLIHLKVAAAQLDSARLLAESATDDGTDGGRVRLCVID